MGAYLNGNKIEEINYVKNIEGNKLQNGTKFAYSSISDFTNFDISEITDMNHMFSNCTSSSINISNWDTSKVTSMGYMFAYCNNLTSLDFSSFDTAKVTDMSNMFDSCMNLTSLNLSTFNTSNVNDMGFMFYDSLFSNIDLSNFDTSKVQDMSYMFSNNIYLESVNLSKSVLIDGVYLTSMFSSCVQLKYIDVSSWEMTSINVSDWYDMFFMCENLTHIKCKQSFKDWCLTKQDEIGLPQAMREGGNGTWEIVE